MNWYLAKMVFRIVSEKNTGKAQFDEQLWLISAAEAEDALQKARQKGLNEEDAFTGIHTGKMRWKFIAVTEIEPIGDLTAETNLVSRIEETDDLKGYLVTIHRKAENLLLQHVF